MTPLVGVSPEAALDCSWRDGVHDGPLVEVAPGETVIIEPRIDVTVQLLDLHVLPDCSAYFDILDLKVGRDFLIRIPVPALAFDLTRSQRIRDPFTSRQIPCGLRFLMRVRNETDAPRKFRAYFTVEHVCEWGGR